MFASSINADIFLIFSEVGNVAINFNKPNVQWLDKLTIEDAKKYLMEKGLTVEEWKMLQMLVLGKNPYSHLSIKSGVMVSYVNTTLQAAK